MPPKERFLSRSGSAGCANGAAVGLRVKGRAPLCEKHLAGRKDEPKVGGNEADA